MVKKRKVVEDDDDFDQDSVQQVACTNIDHVYPPNPGPDTKCYCGKKTWKPFIKLDDYIREGEIIRISGKYYRVEMVNQSRARCRCITADEALQRVQRIYQPDPDDEESGRVINISPRSACERVTESELLQESQPTRSSDMSKSKVAPLPIAGKSSKDREAERKAKLAVKPKGDARPLTGAAAKAKANAKPKVPKTVRSCACGCGDETMSFFVPGHDARWKGWIKKIGSGVMDLATAKKTMGKAFAAAGDWKKSGPGFKPSLNYNGDKYVG